jgi:hypothetical protein
MSHGRFRRGRRPCRQRGAALFFALIILGLMTLLAISAFNIGSVNLKVVTNVQAQQEATAAADAAAQKVISTKTFAAAAGPYTTTVNVDVNNDAVTDYTASVTATCLTQRQYPAPGEVLGPTDPNFIGCFGGVTAAVPLCSQTLWDVASEAVPATTGAFAGNKGVDTTIHQGVAVVMSFDDANTSCP